MTEQIDPARQAGASNTTTWSGAAADVRTPPFLAHPKDVLDDAAHSVEQKRLILASWLSDRHAVPDAPRWRELENGAFVDAHEIEQALRILEDIEASGRTDIEAHLSHPSGESRGRPEHPSVRDVRTDRSRA